jgi:hypothetical protein
MQYPSIDWLWPAARSVYRSNAGPDDQSVADCYRLNIYMPLIDSVLLHLRERFGPVQQKILNLSALIPAYISSFSDIRAAVVMYEAFIEETKSKMSSSYGKCSGSVHCSEKL